MGALLPVLTGSEGFRSRTLSNLNGEKTGLGRPEPGSSSDEKTTSQAPGAACARTGAHTCLHRVSSLCLFLFFRSIPVNDGLKSEASSSAQSSESFVDRETRPHLLLLFGLISPFLCSRPVSIFCVYKEGGKSNTWHEWNSPMSDPHSEISQ